MQDIDNKKNDEMKDADNAVLTGNEDIVDKRPEGCKEAGEGLLRDRSEVEIADSGIKTVREGGKEYLVAKLKSNDTFTGKMIVKNDIGSLLDATSREFNGDAYIYYDVSGRVRFCDMFSGEKDIMEREDVERLCRSFERLTGDIREYLLDIEETKVSMETLFFDPEKKEYEFLYLPDRRSAGCKCDEKPDDGDDGPGEIAAMSGSCSCCIGTGCRKKKDSCSPCTVDTGSSNEEHYCQNSGYHDVRSGNFNEGVRAVWERVMEKFNHHSDIESIARVYDIYQKVSMNSFDPEAVFAPHVKKGVLIKTAEGGAVVSETGERSVQGEVFSKEHLKDTIAGSCGSEIKNAFSYFDVKEDIVPEKRPVSRGKGAFFDGLKMKLAGSAGFFSGLKSDGSAKSDPEKEEKTDFSSGNKSARQNISDNDSINKKSLFSGIKTGKDSKIDEISRSMDEEAKAGYKIKEYLAVNSGNIFKVLMCVAALFLVLALMPGSVAFKPPVSACVGIFLVCVAVAVYARKLGKEHMEEQVKGEV